MGFLQNTNFYHNSLYDWFTSTCILFASVVLARVIYWIISQVLHRMAAKTENNVDDLLIKRIDTPVALGIVLIGFRIAIHGLVLPGHLGQYMHRGFIFMSVLCFIWLLTRIVRVLLDEYFRRNVDGDASGNKQMLQFSKRISIFILWSIGFIVALNNAGFNVGGLIAGLGIGGLAVALAAQDTVKNLIGGLIVFLDKPFRTGDYIKIGNFEGTVHYVGIRSTRIRTLGGRLITFPNAQFSDNPIENISIEPSRRVAAFITIAGNNPPEKLELALSILQEISASEEGLNTVESSVNIEKISPLGIELLLVYFIKKQHDLGQVQTAVYRRIIQRFADAGIELATSLPPVTHKS